MEIEHEAIGEIDQVRFIGRLTMDNAATAREQLKPIIEQGSGRLILDLQAVEFMDSSGLSVLITALKAARQKQGNVVLAQPRQEVQRLIELTRLHQVFKLFPDRDGALDYFAAQTR